MFLSFSYFYWCTQVKSGVRFWARSHVCTCVCGFCTRSYCGVGFLSCFCFLFLQQNTFSRGSESQENTFSIMKNVGFDLDLLECMKSWLLWVRSLLCGDDCKMSVVMVLLVTSCIFSIQGWCAICNGVSFAFPTSLLHWCEVWYTSDFPLGDVFFIKQYHSAIGIWSLHLPPPPPPTAPPSQ